MRNIYTYSAISTKIRAMNSKLLTLNDFKQLAQSENIGDMVINLNKFPNYEKVFKNMDLSTLHRADIEKILTITKFNDFTKIYNFSDIKTRKFLKLYFINYEIAIIKRCLRNCLNNKDLNLDLKDFKTFFKQHSTLNFDNLIQANDKKSFIDKLKGSIYFNILSSLPVNSKINEYETCLDMLFIRQIWKKKDELLTKNEQKAFIKCFGTRIDLLNIQWTYRSKRYFNLPNDKIAALLIPMYYKIKEDELYKLMNTKDLNEFEIIFGNTYYGMKEKKLYDYKPSLEILLKDLLDKFYKEAAMKYPYSINIITSYLYRRQSEIDTLINIIESIKYKLNYEEIISDILIHKTRRNIDD